MRKGKNPIDNNKGMGSGLSLIILLVVVVIAAYLLVTQMGGLVLGGAENTQIEQQDPVEQAQDAVDQLNEKIQEQDY